jgi:sulfite reductase alpha subunit-like flavoprotein
MENFVNNISFNSFNIDSYEICILYGSQTNTAKFASEELERELWKYGYKTKLSSLDAYDIENLPDENLIIFIVSTTGYGEPPTNMKNFWKFLLQKDLPEDSLSELNYTLFGLGDSSYEKFNIVAKMLNNRLRQLSANLFHPVGLGDDQHDFGYEGEFDPWCKSVIEILNNEFFPEKFLKFEKLPIIPKYKVEILNSNQQNLDSAKILIDKENHIIQGKLSKINKITAEDSMRQVIHFQISSENEIKYRPGDVALIYPQNNLEKVEQLIKFLSLDKNAILKITKNPEYHYIFESEYPEFISCIDLFQKWLNINGIPNRHFCRIAADYTDDELHKEKLILFSSKTSVSEKKLYNIN